MILILGFAFFVKQRRQLVAQTEEVSRVKDKIARSSHLINPKTCQYINSLKMKALERKQLQLRSYSLGGPAVSSGVESRMVNVKIVRYTKGVRDVHTRCHSFFFLCYTDPANEMHSVPICRAK